ncbi:acyl carrier protein [Streptomyces sp. NPDC090306]|uniref:acyl carrier protein n=1 Tax=Streptomyces sp. NPDC090306 TaxID=3365961 RepID=UPI003806B206
MSTRQFTLDDLRRILQEGAGVDEAADFGGDIADTGLGLLGYESLALLETAGRIEREFDVELDDEAVTDVDTTPRQLVDLVNACLRPEPAPART